MSVDALKALSAQEKERFLRTTRLMFVERRFRPEERAQYLADWAARVARDAATRKPGTYSYGLMFPADMQAALDVLQAEYGEGA